jgi:hypothetical protein
MVTLLNYFKRLTALRRAAAVCFLAAFAATFTRYHYVYLSLWGVGMVLLIISWRREDA